MSIQLAGRTIILQVWLSSACSDGDDDHAHDSRHSDDHDRDDHGHARDDEAHQDEFRPSAKLIRMNKS